MTDHEATSLYNLSAVLRETGLKADLIRAWERRYNLPRPVRSAGGHRLYSRFDIETLKWLKEKQRQGLSISNAVGLWKSMEESGEDPLEIKDQFSRFESIGRGEIGGNITELRDAWIKACAHFETAIAGEVLNQAFAVHPVEMVITEIMQRGLREIGQQWQSGKLTVQQEHFASSVAERSLYTLLNFTPPPTRPETIVLGCPPGETHTLPVLTLNLFLRRKGYNVIYLGANIPVDQMAATATSLHPQLIILAAQTIQCAASLLETLTSLQQLGVPLAYGGLIFNRVPDLRKRIPGYFLGEDLDIATNSIASILSGEENKPLPTTYPNPYRKLAQRFLDKRTAIELYVHQYMQNIDPKLESIDDAIYYFSNELLAAIHLGDPTLIEKDLEWIKLLMQGRNIQPTHLRVLFKAYRDGIIEHVGVDGISLIHWLDTVNV